MQIIIPLQLSGRDMFTFNPELAHDSDDEGDEGDKGQAMDFTKYNSGDTGEEGEEVDTNEVCFHIFVFINY